MKKVLVAFLCLLLGTVLIACGQEGRESSAGESANSEQSESTIELSNPSAESDEESKQEVSEMAKKAKNPDAIRFASVYDKAGNTGETIYLMTVPYTDTYTLNCPEATEIEVFDYYGESLAKGDSNCTLSLKEKDLVCLKVITNTNSFFFLEVTKEKNEVELPYGVNETTALSSYAVTGDNSVDPLQPCDISYTKRSDGRGMYINCNNPEKLTEINLNTCLCSNDITDRDVFFTFEHNNMSIPFYYGYRVTNTGTKDLFVTIKNFGYQPDGAGSWLGEDEWTKFYNIAFRVNSEGYTKSQKANFDAYVGFCNTYESENRQSVTYVIPAGEYFYVMGGTAEDAYGNINVFGSADKTVKGGCSNGAVIFSVSGSTAKGEFVVYDDISALSANIAKCPQNGYVGDSAYGSQYVGWDDCHGVVDASLTWVFNDATKAGALPVSYKNPFYLYKQSGNRYEDISRLFTTKTFRNVTSWTTHINPNHTETAVGTDMTFYNTVDSVTKEEIIIDYKHFDGKGKSANIGNWMVDYIETFTLVNQGDKERVFTYKMTHSGVILAFVRDEKGFVSDTYSPAFCVNIAKSSYGEAITRNFIYSVTVPAHSVIRFSVDYNLCANSYGHIKHEAILD